MFQQRRESVKKVRFRDTKCYLRCAVCCAFLRERLRPCWAVTHRFLRVAFFEYYSEDTKIEKIRNLFRELIFYCIFVTLATIVISGNLSNYWFTHVMKNEFIDDEFETMYPTPINLLQVRNFEEIWKAIENLLFESIYWDYFYNETLMYTPDRVKLYLIGVPRIRKMCVKMKSCTGKDVDRKHENCYYSLNNEEEEKGSHRGASYESELIDAPYKGIIQTYGMGGFKVDLPLDKLKAWKELDKTRKAVWIDRQTRVVFVDFTIYNANVNVFLLVKVAFETPPTGGVIVSYRLRNAKFIKFAEPFDYYMLGVEVICIFYLLYYTICVVLSIRKYRWGYFASFWNVLDVIIVALGFEYFIVCFVSWNKTDSTISKAIKNKDKFTNFDKLGNLFDDQDTILSILTLLLYFKFFKYINLSSQFGLVNHTIKKSFQDLPAFALVFCFVLMNFTFLGYYLFGTRVFDFSTMEMTVFTLIKALGGEYNYFELEQHFPYCGAIYFIAFIIIVFFIFLNMFLGIISDAYITVKNSPHAGFDDVTIFLNRGARKCKYKCSKCIQYAFKLDEPDPYNRLRNILGEAGYHRAEINLFLKNFDLQRDATVLEEMHFKEELEMFQKKLIDAYEYIAMVQDLATYAPETYFQSFEKYLHELEEKVLDLNKLTFLLYDRIIYEHLQRLREERARRALSRTSSIASNL